MVQEALRLAPRGGADVGQTIAFRGLSCRSGVTGSKNHSDPSMWGRLATCAAVGYRRRPATDAAVGRLPIVRSLASCPTRSHLPVGEPAPFFISFRGPKAHSIQTDDARRSSVPPGAGIQSTHAALYSPSDSGRRARIG